MYLSIFLLVSGNLLLYQALPLVFLILPHKSEPGYIRRLCLTIVKPYGGPSVPFKAARAKRSSQKFT